MTERIASCGCGALTATADGEPVRNSLCHCRDCKRRSGSAFSWNATYLAAQVTVDGAFASWERGSDEGYWARNHFCPKCGITIFFEIERRPGLISIPVGAFADPDFPAPMVEVYEEKRCGWVSALPKQRK